MCGTCPNEHKANKLPLPKRGVFAYVRPAPGVDLNVGDIVGSGISHPCTTFDKWRAIPLIDSNYDVVGAIRTFFQNPSAVHRAGPNPLRGRGGYRVLGRSVLQVTCPLGSTALRTARTNSVRSRPYATSSVS